MTIQESPDRLEPIQGAVEQSIDSIVEFPTNTRLHISLNVSDLRRSVGFYRSLFFDMVPNRVEKGYAKFEVDSPALNLSLNEFPGNVNNEGHFGIQVSSPEELERTFKRLKRAGFRIVTEEGVACCYARQDKFWFADPDGYRWEAFLTTAEEEVEEGCGPDCICHRELERTGAVAA